MNVKTAVRTRARPFLSAEWRFLAMANFAVDPAVVEPWVPRGTKVDVFNGQTFLSVVGFLFRDTRVLGFPIPFHRDFEELNLRFYVYREVEGEIRRGVVFLKELVPRWAVSTVARAVYNENYVTARMRHRIEGFEITPDSGSSRKVSYEWSFGGRWHALHMQASGSPVPLERYSHEEFIAEHYWGYCRQRDGGTVEYHVEHPPWNIWPDAELHFDCNVERIYGREFAAALQQPAYSAFVAEGSPVLVHKPRRIC